MRKKTEIWIGHLTILYVLLALLAALAGIFWWRAYNQELMNYGAVTYAGSLQAELDFREGKKRLYRADFADSIQDSGERKGEIEIWLWSKLDYSNQFLEWVMGYDSTEDFVSAYNNRMRKALGYIDNNGTGS